VAPRLLAISGPLKDSSVPLPDCALHVGRDPANLLSIKDPSLSRRHCILTRDAEGFSIRDLDSRNGTFVNGVAVQEMRLAHGSQISIGDSVFILLLRDEDDPTPDSGQVEYDEGQAQATEQIRPQDILYLNQEQVLRELPAGSRIARNLNALLKISRVVHSIRDLDELQRQILDLIFEVVPAARGAILLDDNGDGSFASVYARHRVVQSTQPVRVSRTITRQVLERGVAILGADVPSSAGLAKVGSLVDLQICSLLCAPLATSQKVAGCIYLDTSHAGSRFDEDHLQFVAAVAGICAQALENARQVRWLEQENLRLATEANLEHNLVGDSAPMRKIYQFLARVAPTDSTVLLQGESGTGKELAARAIHRNSLRFRKPFVAINCAAIPAELLETELFGHESGAYTGATHQKRGRLEIAGGGTVFLDEIGELAPELQVKLLRVLQEREIERLGGLHPISIDIRLIAATNKNLQEAVESGTFRRDLFYRLNVLSLVMPPLRQRREDIPTLVQYFLEKCAAQINMRPKAISPEAMDCLVNYDWPGNVRELENAIERALVLGSSELIRPEDLPESVLEKALPGNRGSQYHSEVRELKKQLIVRALERSGRNYTEAARMLGLHVNYLHRLIRGLELKDSLRPADARRKRQA